VGRFVQRTDDDGNGRHTRITILNRVLIPRYDRYG
jgi:hypothetical protein